MDHHENAPPSEQYVTKPFTPVYRVLTVSCSLDRWIKRTQSLLYITTSKHTLTSFHPTQQDVRP